MLKLKHLFVTLVAFLTLVSALPALADSDLLAGATHGSGNITIQVLDQDGNDIGGVWFLHQGTGDAGLISRNGTLGETFRMPWGFYYLRGQRRAGYESYEVTSENPQEIVPNGMITYTLVYYEDGYAAEQSLMEADTEAAGTTDEAMAEEPVTEEVIEPVAEPAEEPAEDVMEMEDIFSVIYESDRTRLPERSPLHVAPPADSATRVVTPAVVPTFSTAPAQPMQLAVTGPAGLLALLSMSGMGGLFFTFTRRRK